MSKSNYDKRERDRERQSQREGDKKKEKRKEQKRKKKNELAMTASVRPLLYIFESPLRWPSVPLQDKIIT